MEKRWVIVPKCKTEVSEPLEKALGIHPVLIQLLLQRQINTYEKAKQFFRPSLDDLHDPFLMKDMDKAIDRIERAIGSKEKILIYGDYDVDGTTAVALLFGVLSEYHHFNIDYYLPDRYEEGYGLSYKAIDYAVEKDFTLIITLDCGIKELDKVAYARDKGIDIIIGDHHLPGDELPDAYAVLDPKRKDCEYPYKELSGCGIAFKIAQAFLLKNNINPKVAEEYLDLVVVSIASDIVPLTDENRILAHYGLKVLNEKPCIGLKALIELSGRPMGNFSISDILFQIGPRINAAGRIDHAKDAVKLLLCKNSVEAVEFSKDIDTQNTQRKEFDLKITEEALDILAADSSQSTRKTTVLFKEDWHKGVIGIVASRLTEKFYRPTVILTQSNGHVTGSARSVVGFDLYEALSDCGDLLQQYGGHKYAAGLTMDPKNVSLFQEKFEKVVAKRITDDMLVQEIIIDSVIHLEEVDAKFYRLLRLFEPSGPLNEMPVFLSKNVELIGFPTKVGSNHLKITVKQEQSASFDCIGFGLGEYADVLNSGVKFDICYNIAENNWREKRTLQLVLKGIKIKNPD